MARRNFDDEEQDPVEREEEDEVGDLLSDDDDVEDDEFSDDEDDDDDLEDDDDDELVADEDEGEGSTGEGSLAELIAEGEELAESGELREALEVFQESVERYPEESSPHFHLGQTALMIILEESADSNLWEDDAELAGYYELGLAELEEAVDLAPKHVPSLNSLGALHALRENFREAAECWERSLRLSPDQDEVRADLENAREQME